MKFASDMFGLFAYLFVMGGLVPFDLAADLPTGRDEKAASVPLETSRTPCQHGSF